MGATGRLHIEKGAALTIGAVRLPVADSPRFGILEVDADSRVHQFIEKPKDGGAEIPGMPGYCLGSMGIYVFSLEELVRRLRRHDRLVLRAIPARMPATAADDDYA